jgi:gentisate 1,2-dioxygenase
MATRAETPYTKRARYYSSAEAFNIVHSEIPDQVFLAERDRALEGSTPTGLIALDLSGRLGCGFPATTPLVLARYARIRAGESLTTRFAAVGELYYVIAGAGGTTRGRRALTWESGDAFCLPGGGATEHRAAQDAVLWIVTDEPLLAFLGSRPAPGSRSPIEVVHYPAAEIRRGLERIHSLPVEQVAAGKSLMLSSAALDGPRTATPTFSFAMNSLAPGEAQRAHRHNAVAVTLIVQGEGCHSLIDGRCIPWQPWATMITPPGSFHSHHNQGSRLAMFLIAQDGGLHYHARTMGFSYD